MSPREAFVFSLIQKQETVQAIVDMASMPRGEVVAILAQLARWGLVRL